jgi:hypothetical protein
MEFYFPEAQRRKIPWNFCTRKLQDEKFHGISVSGVSVTKNTSRIRLLKISGKKNNPDFLDPKAFFTPSPLYLKYVFPNISYSHAKKHDILVRPHRITSFGLCNKNATFAQ